MCLGGGGVDGECHAAAAVVALGAEHPEGVGGHDLHGNLGRGDNGVVGVGHEAGVHTAGEGVAGGVESGLGDGVVLAVEGEDDHVTNIGGDLLREEGETLRTTDVDGMGGTGAGNDTASTGLDGGGDTVDASNGGGSSARGDGDGLSHSHLLVESGGRKTTTLVNPDDDGVDAADGTETNASNSTDASNDTANTGDTTDASNTTNADVGIPPNLPASASGLGNGQGSKKEL